MMGITSLKNWQRMVRLCVMGVMGAGLSVFLAACEDPIPDEYANDPEVRHCYSALKRLARDKQDVTLVRARPWMVEKVKNVSLLFDYLDIREEFPDGIQLRGIIHCQYALDYTVRGDKHRAVMASMIRIRNYKLSDSELILLNTSIAGEKIRLRP